MFLYPFLPFFFCYLISCIRGQKTKRSGLIQRQQPPPQGTCVLKEGFDPPPHRLHQVSFCLILFGHFVEHMSQCAIAWEMRLQPLYQSRKKWLAFHFTKLFPVQTLFVRICTQLDTHLWVNRLPLHDLYIHISTYVCYIFVQMHICAFVYLHTYIKCVVCTCVNVCLYLCYICVNAYVCKPVNIEFEQIFLIIFLRQFIKLSQENCQYLSQKLLSLMM